MAIEQHELITRIQHSMSAIQTAALYGMVKTACFGMDKGQDIIDEIDAVLREVDTLQGLRKELRDKLKCPRPPTRLDAVPERSLFLYTEE